MRGKSDRRLRLTWLPAAGLVLGVVATVSAQSLSAPTVVNNSSPDLVQQPTCVLSCSIQLAALERQSHLDTVSSGVSSFATRFAAMHSAAQAQAVARLAALHQEFSLGGPEAVCYRLPGGLSPDRSSAC
jgi:hypothetical protein